MSKPILDPEFWRLRLNEATERHRAIFHCAEGLWRAIERRHREILRRVVQPGDSILDAGCAWGRLLTLLPEDWSGDYLGIDLSPDFIELACHEHPSRRFVLGDIRNADTIAGTVYDWGILISIRPMVVGNLGVGVWADMERSLRRVCRRLLFLEYVEEDEGSVE